jgi:hypothetical protein
MFIDLTLEETTKMKYGVIFITKRTTWKKTIPRQIIFSNDFRKK